MGGGYGPTPNTWFLGPTGVHSQNGIFAQLIIVSNRHSLTRDHTTDALISLHWLQVPERIQYKLAVLAYKVLHGDAPRYLGPLTSVDDLPGRRTLRSTNANCLVVPPVKLSRLLEACRKGEFNTLK